MHWDGNFVTHVPGQKGAAAVLHIPGTMVGDDCDGDGVRKVGRQQW